MSSPTPPRLPVYSVDVTPKDGADPEVARRALDSAKREAASLRRASARLTQSIAEAASAGNSLRDIAAATGLNHQTVANRLKQNGE